MIAYRILFQRDFMTIIQNLIIYSRILFLIFVTFRLEYKITPVKLTCSNCHIHSDLSVFGGQIITATRLIFSNEINKGILLIL